MMIGKFLNPRDVLIIVAVTLAMHILLRPLYNRIDSAAGGD